MKIRKRIKVLVVDDSLFFRSTIIEGLKGEPSIEVIGSAKDPYDARDKILELRPDVLTLDVEMPRMSGIDFLKKLMPQYPLPTIMISSADIEVFEAIDAGAVDFMEKPKVSKKSELDSFYKELILKIKIASTVKLPLKKTKSKKIIKPSIKNLNLKNNNFIITIGASTGGTEAVQNIIKTLPENMPPILIVQHMPPVFTKMYSERLNKISKLFVKEAENEDLLESGKVILARGGSHMKIYKQGRKYKVCVYEGDKVNGHRPSVEPLFNSAAQLFGENSIGVILTGMGTDGAKALLNMKKAGAYTIGQDEETSIVYGMPKVAYHIGGVVIQKPLGEISDEIIKYLSKFNNK